MSNTKRGDLQRKSWRKHRIRKAESVRRQGGTKQASIAYPELITQHMLRKRTTSNRANITLSGKKKRKLEKQLKHMQADKARKEVEEAGKKKTEGKSKKDKSDVEMTASGEGTSTKDDEEIMDEEDEEDEEET